MPGGYGGGGWGDTPPLSQRLAEWWRNSNLNQGIVQPAISAAMLPGDVYSGAQPTMSFSPQTGLVGPNPDLMRRSADLASNLAGGGLATAGMRPGLGIFGGRLAKTADLAALKRAETLAGKGASREDIFKETGWFKGPDDKWRFEIDDSASRIGDKALNELAQMGTYGSTQRLAAGVLHHKPLYEAYPSARNIDVDARYNSDLSIPSASYEVPSEGRGGRPQITAELNKLSGDTGPQSLMLHEMQHHIQDVEDFAPGGTPSAMYTETEAGIANRIKFAKSLVEEAEAELRHPKASAADKVFAERRIAELTAELADLQAKKPRTTFEAYQALAGETEARNVQQRRLMTADARKQNPPWATQDIPYDQQIVRSLTKYGIPASAITAAGASQLSPENAQAGTMPGPWEKYAKPASPQPAGPWQKYGAPTLRPFDATMDKPRSNADGSYSTEITRTVQTPSGWANVPSLWYGQNGPVDMGQMNDDQLADFATKYEQQSGKQFPRFKDLTAAETEAKRRSAGGGATQGPLASSPPPSAAPDGGSWLDPFVGQGILMGAGDEIKAGVRAGARRMFGSSGKDLSGLYNEELANARADLGDFQARHPTLTPALEVAGAVATTPLVPGGVVARGASLGARIGRGAAAGAGYGAVSGFASGDGTQDRLAGAASGGLTGAALGGAAPAVVRGAQAVGRGARDYFVRPATSVARGVVNRDREAARRIGMAMQRDASINQPMITPADEAVARISGGPLLNLDRGGETVRALARSSANTSPEARIAMETAVSDRYAAQGDRTSDTVRRIVGGMGAPATLESLERSARAANRSAYQAAYREGDRGIWSPTLERLTSSPAVVKAMRDAAERGKDRAVVEGFGGFRPGVTVDPSGIVTFRRGANGQPTYPNLQYWDYVKRELDDSANAARRSGKREEASTLGGLAEQLRGELDNQVPSFAQARAGAARFFGARDALEAGQEFVSSRMDNDAARQALAKMSAPERQLFAQGFADSLTQRISEVGDRRNVINSLFIRSPASRERIEMALGPQRAQELEAFLHVEALMDRARSSFGNSTTARQLTELGMAGGAGSAYGLATGDWHTAGAAAITGILLRRGMGRIDRAVAQRVGEMLASPDPAVVQRGLRQVANNGRIMDALRYADIPAALGATEAANQSQPLKIYLSAGERDSLARARALGGPNSLYQPPPTQ